MTLNIQMKLIGGFLIMVALLLAVFGAVYTGLSAIGRSADTILSETEPADHLMGIKALIANESQLYADYSLTRNSETLGEAQALSREIATASTNLRLQMTADEARDVDSFLAAHDQFVSDGEKMASVYVAGDWEGGNEQMAIWDGSRSTMLAVLDEMEATSAQSTLAAEAISSGAGSSATMLTAIIAVAAALVAIALGFFLSQKISKGISSVAFALKNIIQVDLATGVSVASKDEIGDAASSHSEMQESL